MARALPLSLLSTAAVVVVGVGAPPTGDDLDDARAEQLRATTRTEGAAIVRRQIAQLSRGRTCTATPWLSERVLVVNSTSDGSGRRQFDTAVVREVSFDEALRAAQAGQVWVLAYCEAPADRALTVT